MFCLCGMSLLNKRRTGDTKNYISDTTLIRVNTVIISYPTSASGIIVLLKTPSKYREFFPTLFVKISYFQLDLNFEQTSTVTIFGQYRITAHTP